jgi:hypothetical protein
MKVYIPVDHANAVGHVPVGLKRLAARKISTSDEDVVDVNVPGA